MTEKILKIISIGIIIAIVAVSVLYFGFIYLMGRNFVHEGRASPEYYDHMANRIYFTAKYRGDKFDQLLDSFLKNNPQYVYTGPMNLAYNDSCSCNCLPFAKTIYFNGPPEEAYQITYDSDTMYAAGAGVIDIVFIYKNNKWICTKSSKLDSLEKNRVTNRFDTAILEKLK